MADGRIVEPSSGYDATTAQTLDCTGKYVMPGMVDAHVHLKSRDGHFGTRGLPGWDADVPDQAVLAAYGRTLHSFLRCGVTSLYDAGNIPDVIYSLRRWGLEGSLVSPRIHCTGRMLTSVEGHGAEIGRFVDDDTDVDELLADHLTDDSDLVKIAYDEHNWGVRPLITIVSTPMLRRLIDGIHHAGKRAIVHASSELRAREALACGADVLAHPVIQSPVTDEFVALVAELGVPVVSTLAIGERYFRLIDDPQFLRRGMYAYCGDPETERPPVPSPCATALTLPWTDWMRVMTPIAQENLRRLSAAGAVVATGTDLSFGPDFHRELELLRSAGLSSWEIIRSATHHGALALGRGTELGTIAPGSIADLVVLGADPTVDAGNIAAVEHVLLGGHLVDLSALDLAINA